MPKRINLQVDKLMAKPCKKPKEQVQKTTADKHLSFEQLYQMARKATGHANSRMISSQPHTIYSSNTSQQTFQSLKNSRQTPQNTNRQANRINQKLNRSLQTKSQQTQHMVGSVRCFSGGKYQNSEKGKRKNQKKAHLRQQALKDLNFKKGVLEEFNPPLSEQALFQLQFIAQLKRLDHSKHQHLRQTECFLGLDQSYQLMKGLNYLRKMSDQKYFVRLWQELQGEGYGGVPSSNLFEFLGYINQYNPVNYYQKHLQQKNAVTPARKIKIDGNLKIVVSEKGKLEIYEEYLALRVNRILYGNSTTQHLQCEKKLHRTSNIKIIDDDTQHSEKEKLICNNGSQKRRVSFKKKECQEASTVNPLKRTVRLKSSANPKTRKFQDLIKCQADEKYKMKNEDSSNEGLETRQSKNNLTSNQSESSIHSVELIEQKEIQDRKPLLSIDVNLGQGVSEKLVVYEGESATQVSQRLVEKYKIDDSLRIKFEGMLSGHLRNLLWRIQQVSEQMFSDRQQ